MIWIRFCFSGMFGVSSHSDWQVDRGDNQGACAFAGRREPAVPDQLEPVQEATLWSLGNPGVEEERRRTSLIPQWGNLHNDSSKKAGKTGK